MGEVIPVRMERCPQMDACDGTWCHREAQSPGTKWLQRLSVSREWLMKLWDPRLTYFRFALPIKSHTQQLSLNKCSYSKLGGSEFF